jgi:hypothetical protein
MFVPQPGGPDTFQFEESLQFPEEPSHAEPVMFCASAADVNGSDENSSMAKRIRVVPITGFHFATRGGFTTLEFVWILSHRLSH